MNWLKANRLSVKDPFINPINDLSIRSSIDSKIRSTKGSENDSPEKIKSNPSFTLDKINTKTITNAKSNLASIIKHKDPFKLPSLKKVASSEVNPE